MLDRVVVENFRCLSNVDVPLAPLTVLIGKNDTGKSVFLDAVARLVAEDSSFSTSDYWQDGQRADLLPNLQASIDGHMQRKLFPERGERSRGIQIKSEDITEVPRPLFRFQAPSTGIAMECDGYNESGKNGAETFLLGGDGSRVAAMLDYLLRNDRKRFAEVSEVLSRYVPGLVDINISTPSPVRRRIDLVLNEKFKMPADRASVGVKSMIFFVTLAFMPNAPKTILLEEPENGVHPRRLADIVSLLRDLTTGKNSPIKSQVILTTHSPYLLDSIDLETDKVIVFRRGEDGFRTAEPVSKERLQGFMDEFMLGEIWYNQEESGLIAK